jgi:hypothetical protein
MTTADENKKLIAQQDRALKSALLLTRENLVAAGKLTARTIARAEDTISKAGLALLWAINGEGKALMAVAHDYDRDIAPIVSTAMSEAYGSNKASQKTMRAYGKLFFLAGVHSLDTDETSMNKIVDSFRAQLKESGLVSEEGQGKGGGRKPRPATAKDDKASSTDTSSTATTESPLTATSSTDVPVAEPSIPSVVKPGKAYTVEVRRNAALILSGTPALSADIVQAFEVHREQVLKFIRTLIESDKAVKA